MFTGLVDSVHGCLDNDTRLAESHDTLAERLFSAGYETIGFYTGPSIHPVFGLSQGFENYVDCTGLGGMTLNALRAGERLDGEALQLHGSHSYFIADRLDQALEQRLRDMDVHPTGPLWGQGDLPVRGDCRELEVDCLAPFTDWQQGLSKAGLRQERRGV